ncbi:MAG: hypothetical protein ACTSU5_08435 [Promethearchaeota archaeon]
MENFQEFSERELESINWSITGYENTTYVLKNDDSVVLFGEITSNSTTISQPLFGGSGQHLFTIKIYANGSFAVQKSVVLIINSGASFWNTYGALVGRVVGVGSGVAAGAGVWKRFSTRKREKDKSREHESQFLGEARQVLDPFLATSDEEAEQEYTFISSTRVRALWLIARSDARIEYLQVFQEDFVDDTRRRTVEESLLEIVKKLEPSGVGPRQDAERSCLFIQFRGVREPEMCGVFLVGETHALFILFGDRITKTYSEYCERACSSLKSIIEEKRVFPGERCYAALDQNLGIRRSFNYVEPFEEKKPIFQKIATQWSWGPEHGEILDDVHNLTPNECEWILQRMTELGDREGGNSIFDEVEML